MIKILIVEDDPAIAEIHRRFVQRLPGFEVLGVALTLFDAREQIGILRPDLVLLDVWLPDGEGFSLLRELRQAGASLDVILLTAAREAAALLHQEACKGLIGITFARLEVSYGCFVIRKDLVDNRNEDCWV